MVSTDATGVYEITFTNPLGSDDYAVTAIAEGTAGTFTAIVSNKTAELFTEQFAPLNEDDKESFESMGCKKDEEETFEGMGCKKEKSGVGELGYFAC